MTARDLIHHDVPKFRSQTRPRYLILTLAKGPFGDHMQYGFKYVVAGSYAG